MTSFEILSLLAIFLSAGTALFVGFVEYRRYYLTLKMRIHSWKVVWHNENSSIVDLKMSFVNPSTRGKTVFHIRGKTPLNVTASALQGQYDLTLPNVVYKLPSQQGYHSEYQVIASQTLPIPLDIPPHLSHSGHCIYQIDWNIEVDGTQKLSIPFVALDIDGIELSRCSLNLTINDLKTVGFYADLTSFVPYPP
jgi:hypothetical protein